MLYLLKDMKLEMPQKLAPSQQTIADIETAPPKKSGKVFLFFFTNQILGVLIVLIFKNFSAKKA